MLTTLVYRYGLPGNATRSAAAVQANGQCFIAERRLLVETHAFFKARASICEDVEVARMLARAGNRVGFYEADTLAVVRMHDTWRDLWLNWPRSLTLRDGISAWHTAIGFAEIFFVQALPLAFVLLLMMGGHDSPARAVAYGLNMVLVGVPAWCFGGNVSGLPEPAVDILALTLCGSAGDGRTNC